MSFINYLAYFIAAGLHSIVLYGTEAPAEEASPSSVATTDLTLCIGLIVAFIIFLVVVICIVKTLRNKSIPHHPGYTLTSSGGGNFTRSVLCPIIVVPRAISGGERSQDKLPEDARDFICKTTTAMWAREK